MPGKLMNQQRNASSSVGGIMKIPPNKFGTTVGTPKGTHGASYHGSAYHNGATVSRVNAGVTDKVVSKPNAFPQFRKKPASAPAAKENIFSSPVKPPLKIERMHSVAQRMHTDPFDGARQNPAQPLRHPKKKLATPRQVMAHKYGTRRVKPDFTVADGFVAGSNLVFAGGKKQYEAAPRDNPTQEIPQERCKTSQPPERRLLKSASPPSCADPKILHFDPTHVKNSPLQQALSSPVPPPPMSELTVTAPSAIKETTTFVPPPEAVKYIIPAAGTPGAKRRGSIEPHLRSVMMGGLCKPASPSRFRRSNTAVTHPPWHTSTPRQGLSEGAKPASRHPPWHTSTPRSGPAAAAPRSGVRRVNNSAGANNNGQVKATPEGKAPAASTISPWGTPGDAPGANIPSHQSPPRPCGRKAVPGFSPSTFARCATEHVTPKVGTPFSDASPTPARSMSSYGLASPVSPSPVAVPKMSELMA